MAARASAALRMAEAALAISRNLGDSSHRMAALNHSGRGAGWSTHGATAPMPAGIPRVHSGSSLGENDPTGGTAMARARRYRLVGAWALMQIVAGGLVIFTGALAALAVLLPW